MDGLDALIGVGFIGPKNHIVVVTHGRGPVRWPVSIIVWIDQPSKMIYSFVGGEMPDEVGHTIAGTANAIRNANLKDVHPENISIYAAVYGAIHEINFTVEAGDLQNFKYGDQVGIDTIKA